MRLVLTFIAVLMTSTAFAEDINVQACRTIFSEDETASAQCLKFSPSVKGQPLQTLSDKQLKSFCSRFDSVKGATRCFAEIGWLRFFKNDLAGENIAGLASQFADMWKDVSVESCYDATTNSNAIDCAIQTRTAVLASYEVANKQARRNAQDADPILKNCRAEWKEDYEMIEYCVKKQRAAKARLGID